MVKKGQITIFIIIGIVLLIALGISIYFYTTKVVKPIEEVAIPTIQKAPTEVQPIQEYITSCVNTVGKTALNRIGDYGGYIDTTTFMFNPAEPTEGDAVQFSPDSGLIIPYWWFLESDNDCTGRCEFSSLRPPLFKSEGRNSIEEQLNTYISDHLKDCLAGFIAYENQGFEFKELGEPKAETTIAKENVVVLVKYPLQIQKADQTFSLNEYVTSIDLSLGNIYDLATHVSNAQAENGVLEHFTKEMITQFSSLGSNGIPPMHEIDFEFGAGTIWVKYAVEQRLQEILTSYVPMLQVGNTRYYRYVNAPNTTSRGDAVENEELFEVLFNRGLLFTIPEKTYPELGVKFTYLPWWSTYFDLNCDGEACMSESVSQSFYFVFGIQRYMFAYDVSYPVLVEIYDPTAFKGEGYSFKFFIESNMRNNFAMPSVFEPLQTYNIETTSMLCDIKQRTSGNITINVRDSRTKKGIDKALIGYRCGKESCAIGETANGTLVAQLPRCIGGQLTASKQEYQAGMTLLDVVDDTDLDALIELEPYRIVDFNVKKWMLKKGAGWNLDTEAPVAQDLDEDTIIMMKRITKENDAPFNVFADVCGRGELKSPGACGAPPEDMSQDIRILPGDYEVQIYSFKYPMPPMIIPKDKRLIHLPWGKKEYYIPEEDIVFDAENPFPSGFAQFNITIEPEQLENVNTMEFYYINVALDKVPEEQRKIEDMEQLGKSQEYSTAYRELLEPKLMKK